MRKSKSVIAIAVALSMVSCSSSKKFDDKISEKDCEAALENIPGNQNDYQLISKVKEASGTVLSYSATGAAYTVQLLWDVTATVGAVVILCSPNIIIAAAAAATGGGHTGTHCLPGDDKQFNSAVKAVQAPYLGSTTYKKTESWRCPPVDNISHSIRQVSQCYVERGGEENRQKARKTLQTLADSENFFDCLSQTEKDLLAKNLSDLK